MNPRIFIIAFLIITSWSCKKEKAVIAGFDNSAKVIATIRGKVIDQDGNAITMAKVSINGKVATSYNGSFTFSNASVFKNAQIIVAEASGHFKTFKTISSSEGKETFTVIVMQKKENPISFEAMSGAFIDQQGVLIELPRLGYKYKTDGKLYNGKVNVYIKTHNAKDADFVTQMPGGVIGINADNESKILSFFSILGVELEDANGAPLQLIDGVDAKISMPIPADQLSKAPNELTFGHLDEATGLWMEEGIAKKVGNTYQATVTHFSYWGFWYPTSAIPFVPFVSMNFVDANNIPLANMKVVVTLANGTNYIANYLNSQGFTVIPVAAAGSTNTITLYPENCPLSVYSTTFTAAASNGGVTYLGTYNIGINSSMATIQGTTVDCNNAPIANAKIELLVDGRFQYFRSDNNGNFSRSFSTCGGSSITCVIKAADIDVYGKGTYILAPGINAIGNFACCGYQIPFVEFEASVDSGYSLHVGSYVSSKNDFLTPFTNFTSGVVVEYPQYNLQYASSLNSGNTSIACSQGHWSLQNCYDLQLSFSGTAGNYFINNITSSAINNPQEVSVTSDPCNIPITITQYSQNPSSGYIEGDFSGYFYHQNGISKIKATGHFLVDRNF